MKWEQETWRKLYVRVDARWLQLPVSARGLGSELLKYADDSGRIHLGTDEAPGISVAFLLSARPREHKRIAEDVALLMSEEHSFLVHEGGGTYRIRNFEKAQAKSGSAIRMAKLRDNRRVMAPPSPSHVTSLVRGVVTSPGDAVVASPVTEQSDGSDPIRSDPPMPPKGGGTPQAQPEPIPPEGAADVAWLRALRLAEAQQPDAIGYDQRLRPEVVNAMAGRWAAARAKGETWVAYVARLDADVLGWVTSIRGTEQAKFCVGWPWRAFLARAPGQGSGPTVQDAPRPSYHQPFAKQPWEMS